VTAAVVALCWPIPTRQTLVGLEPSWQAATHLARFDGLAWGRDVLFAQGPLGFLSEPRLVTPGAMYPLAVLAHALLLAAWIVVLARLLAPRMGVIAGWVVAMLAAGLVVAPFMRVHKWAEAAVALLVVVGLVAVQRSRLTVPAAAGLGVAGGLLLLVRYDAGVLALVLGVLIVAAAAPFGEHRLRHVAGHVAAFALAAVAAVVVGWVAAGQPLDSLGEWLRAGREFIAGYSGAFALENGPRWHYAAAAALAVVVLWLAATAPALGRRRRYVLVAIVVVVLAVGARQSFIRHDDVHAGQFFVLAAAVALALAAASGRLGLPLAVAAVTGVVAISAGHLDASPHRATRHARDAAAQMRLVLSPARRGAQLRATRAAILRGYGLPARFAAMTTGRGVHVLPWDAALMAALPAARWRPLPVIQDYAATTPWLDERNADALAGPRRPDVLLRRVNYTIDGRLERFEPPREALALACRYRQVALDRASGWQVLAPGADRCGAEHPLGRAVTVRPGRLVPVPSAPPGEAVVVRLAGIGTGLSDRLRTAVLRGPQVALLLPGLGLPPVRTSLGTQGSPRLLNGPRCLTDLLDAPRLPFAHSIGVAARGLASGGRVRVAFASLPVDCRR
jgi:hypothetical protein